MKKPGLISAAVLAAVFAIHLLGLPHTVQIGDTGELVADALLLKIPHPPGYPLYVWIYHAFIRLFPWGSVFFRAALLTSMISVGTLACLLAIGRHRLPAVAMALCLATSALYWRYSLLPDVFSLNNLLCAAFLAVYFREGKPKSRDCLAAGVLAGLGMSNHLTFVFICPLLLHLLWLRRSWKAAFGSAVTSLAILCALYGSLLGLNPQDPYSWGSLRGPRDVIGHFLREDYSRHAPAAAEKRGASLFIQEAFAEAPSAAAPTPVPGEKFLAELRWGARSFLDAFRSPHFREYLADLARTTLLGLLPLLALAATCLIPAARRRDTRTLAVGGCAAFYCVVMFSQIKIIPTEPAKAVVERFYLMPQVLLAGMALRAPGLLPELGGFWTRRRLSLAASLLGLLAAGLNFVQHHRASDLSRNTIAEDYALNFLELASARDGAIILANNDTMYFTLRYAQLVHGRNPAALVLSLPLLFHPWYVAKARMILPGFVLDEAMIRDRGRLILEEDLIRPNLPAHPFHLSGRFSDSVHFKLTHLPLGRKVEAGSGEYFDESARARMTLRSGPDEIASPPGDYDPYRDIYSEYAYFDLARGIAESASQRHEEALTRYRRALERVPYCIPALQGVCIELDRMEKDSGQCRYELDNLSMQIYDYFRFLLK